MFEECSAMKVRASHADSRVRYCVIRRLTSAAVVLIAVDSQCVLAAISFSGDVSLNTGVPNSPLTVGNGAIGSLQIDNGSTLSSGISQIAVKPNGIGFVTVTGPRTTWTAQSLDVAADGIGRLDVLNAGIVSVAGQLRVGANPSSNGTLTIDGAGSTVQVNGALSMGNLDNGSIGTVEISNGGILNAIQGTTTIGLQSRVLLDGGLLRVATLNHRGLLAGSGEVNFVTGNLLSSTGRIAAGAGDLLRFTGSNAQTTFENQGVIEIYGGEIELFRNLSISKRGPTGGEVTLRNGTLRISTVSGTTLLPQFRNNGLLATDGGDNHFYGTVLSGGDGIGSTAEIAVTNQSKLIFHDDVSVQGGMFTVFPGSKATLLEDLALKSGSLLLADIAGSNIDTGYGEIEVVGNVTLGGALQVVLSNGFTPEAGDSFQILKSFGGIEGSLALEAMPALPGQLAWDLDVTANQVLLNVVTAPTGDFNRDGTVDTADFLVWRKSAGTSGSDLAADANHDGSVDDADYTMWKANFGATAGTHSAGSVALNAAVPEPATLGMLLIGLTAARLIGRAVGDSRRT